MLGYVIVQEYPVKVYQYYIGNDIVWVISYSGEADEQGSWGAWTKATSIPAQGCYSTQKEFLDYAGIC